MFCIIKKNWNFFSCEIRRKINIFAALPRLLPSNNNCIRFIIILEFTSVLLKNVFLSCVNNFTKMTERAWYALCETYVFSESRFTKVIHFRQHNTFFCCIMFNRSTYVHLIHSSYDLTISDFSTYLLAWVLMNVCRRAVLLIP